MYPFIHLGPLTIGTFGIMLWLAAVIGCWVLHLNFKRWQVDADAVTIVAFATIAGVIGAKLWNVLETPHLLMAYPVQMLFSRGGFAWFGGLVGAILALLWQGHSNRLSNLRTLDLCAPSAALGYGVGRWGCQLSGDGDYGIPTHMWFGMSYPHGTVPTTQRVYPTPIFEFIVATIIFYILWRWSRPGAKIVLGQMTAHYLIWTGVARFLVEFIRRNPKIYFGLSNAQVASLGSIIAGIILFVWAKKKHIPLEPGKLQRPAKPAKPKPEAA